MRLEWDASGTHCSAKAQYGVSRSIDKLSKEDGKYFKDSDNDQELDPFEDWRLSTGERVADLVGKLNQDQRIGLLRNALRASPEAATAEQAYHADGTVNLGALLALEYDPQSEDKPASFVASNVTDGGIRAGVIRKDTDTETGALYNNALNMMSEWVAVSKGEVMIPFMVISNPMISGYPQGIGFGAAAAGDGYDVIKRFAELDATIWDAKGIHQMYGPQIDLITDPRCNCWTAATTPCWTSLSPWTGSRKTSRNSAVTLTTSPSPAIPLAAVTSWPC